jgi:hypothetical protein
MRRDLLIVTTPNTGSTWLTKLLARHSAAPYYDKEFFNPVCNPLYRDYLGERFGCELVSMYHNIALPMKPGDLEEVLAKTWWRHAWRFNKENQLAWKLEAFRQFFDVVVLWRRMDNVFPPSRPRVWGWYEAFYVSALEAGIADKVEGGVVSRAMEGWRLAWDKINQDSADLPRIDYDLLMNAETPEEIEDHLAQLTPVLAGFNPVRAAREIYRTRTTGNKTWRELD